jgi:hypothetical protein
MSTHGTQEDQQKQQVTDTDLAKSYTWFGSEDGDKQDQSELTLAALRIARSHCLGQSDGTNPGRDSPLPALHSSAASQVCDACGEAAPQALTPSHISISPSYSPGPIQYAANDLPSYTDHATTTIQTGTTGTGGNPPSSNTRRSQQDGASGDDGNQLRWYRPNQGQPNSYSLLVPDEARKLIPAPLCATLPYLEEPLILGRLNDTSPIYAEPLYANKRPDKGLPDVDDWDLSIFAADCTIRRHIDRLINNLQDPGVLADVHRLRTYDRRERTQTHSELNHFLSSPPKLSDYSAPQLECDTRLVNARITMTQERRVIEQRLQDACVHSRISPALDQILLRPYLPSCVYHLRGRPLTNPDDRNVAALPVYVPPPLPVRVGRRSVHTQAQDILRVLEDEPDEQGDGRGPEPDEEGGAMIYYD